MLGMVVSRGCTSTNNDYDDHDNNDNNKSNDGCGGGNSYQQ